MREAKKVRQIKVLPNFRNFSFFTIGLLTFSSLLSTSKILLDNFSKQLYSSYGISDEGFVIALLKMRSEGNTNANIWPFTEILRIPYEISGGNISFYRILGLISIAVLFGYVLFVTLTSISDKLAAICVTTVTLTLFLNFPTPFRFLLVTPGYQWIIIVSSTFITLLMMLRKKIFFFNRLDVTIVNFFVFCSILARPTSGAIILICLGIFSSLYMKFFLTRFLLPQICVWLAIIVFNIVNLRNRFSAQYFGSQAYDPEGYSLVREILDVGIPFLLYAAIVILSFFISRRLTTSFLFTKIRPFLPIAPWVSALCLLFFDLSKSQLLLFSLFYAFIIGVLSFVVVEKLYTVLKLFFLSFMPFFAQFGSNIHSLSNPLYLFLSLSIFFVSLLIFSEQSSKYSIPKFNFRFMVIFILFLNSTLYLNYAQTIDNENYEKSVGGLAQKKSSVNGLMYDESRLQKLEKFKSQANLDGQRITDLSFFHPGLILFAGGNSYGFSLPDDYFIESIKLQLDFLIKRNDSKMLSKDSLVLLKSMPSKESFISQEVDQSKNLDLVCVPLTTYISSNELSEAIQQKNIDVKVRLIAVYESSPEDLTLYPNSAALVKVC